MRHCLAFLEPIMTKQNQLHWSQKCVGNETTDIHIIPMTATTPYLSLTRRLLCWGMRPPVLLLLVVILMVLRLLGLMLAPMLWRGSSRICRRRCCWPSEFV